MNINSYILLDYLKIPVRKSYLKSSNLQRPLRGIAFFREGRRPEPSYATLVQSKELETALRNVETGCFLCPHTAGGADSPMPEKAVSQTTPDVIFVDGSVDMTELYEAVRGVFQEFEELEQKMNGLIREDAPLNLFGNALLPYLYNPISLYSENMRLIFYSERKKALKERIYFEHELNMFLPDEEIQELKIDKEYNETIDAVEPFIFSANRWGYRILCHNLREGGIYIARLMALETDRPLRQSDYALLLYLADYVLYMMNKKEMHFNNHPRYLDECLQQLMEGQKAKREHLEIALTDMGWRRDDRYLCVVVFASRYDQRIRGTIPLALRLEKTLQESAALVRDDQIILLVNLSRNSFPRMDILQRLVYILREGMLKAGVSREFRSVELAGDYYQQAVTAVWIGNRKNPMFWCYYYEDYALARLLEKGRDGRCTQSLIPSGLRRLMDYDERKHQRLTHALKIYLRQNMRIADTIRVLYMQRATFLYQLKRIQEISGLKLDQPDVRLELLIVFRIMDETE